VGGCELRARPGGAAGFCLLHRTIGAILRRYGAFEDQDEFRRCKREMESYQSEAQDLLSCTKREADDLISTLKRKSDSVIEEYNSAVESFNRRARG